MAEIRRSDREPVAVQAAVGKSRKLAARIPRLMLDARRVAATIIHGVHGRRRAGPGETFWQYRRFVSGEPSRQCRLAALGARRSSLCARARMGSLAHDLAVAGSLAVDGVPLRL